jgi:hypothetical protein
VLQHGFDAPVHIFFDTTVLRLEIDEIHFIAFF